MTVKVKRKGYKLTYTWDMVPALESASPPWCNSPAIFIDTTYIIHRNRNIMVSETKQLVPTPKISTHPLAPQSTKFENAPKAIPSHS